MVMTESTKELGRIIHERRRRTKLTLQKLSALSGVSPSHLARIERKERFPSARILHKIARPLNFNENELFMLAGYLSYPVGARSDYRDNINSGLDPEIVSVLAQQPHHMQRAVVDIINILQGLEHPATAYK